MTINVHISDAKVSTEPAAVLATHSLGSCIGVAAYDPVAKVGGMLHYQLPDSLLDTNRALAAPLMFADTGMGWLIGRVVAAGAKKSRLRVSLAGAAQMIDDGGVFNIGRRNHAAIRKVLWQHGLLIAAEDVGGSIPRNLYLSIGDGAVSVRSGNALRSL
jgi:chemotaxis protein CheD